MDDVTGFVLAGGLSSRMGREKALVPFGGHTLLEHALALLRQVVAEPRIVGAHDKFAAFAPVIEDVYAGRGPLGGIHAALAASETELNLVLAVDLPLMQPEFLRYLVGRAGVSKALAIVPRAPSEPAGPPRWQPLCAAYRRAFAAHAERALAADRNRIDRLFSEVPVLVIEAEEIAARGFGASIFHNANTPEDLAKLAPPIGP